MTRYKARVYTTLKPEHIDTIGIDLLAKLKAAGFAEVESVKTSKMIEVEFDAEPAEAEDKIEQMCRQLLAHPVTEIYTIRFTTPDGRLVEFLPTEEAERFQPVPMPIVDLSVAPPRFYEEDNNVKVFDLCRHHRLEYGPIRFTRADYKEYDAGRFPFCVRVFYSIYSYEMPLPIRLDIEKRAFLDDFDFRGPGMGTLAIYDMRERYEADLKINAAMMVASVVIVGLHTHIRKG